MGLLTPLENHTAYLKLGMLGFAGSGKTFTAVEIAMGLCKEIKNDKIAFFDTEKGSDFHGKRVRDAGLKFDGIKSRSFSDLLETIKEAEQGKYGVLIIDSISHVWKDLMDSYLKAKGRKFISLPDWGPLKSQWAEFSDAFVNSKIHIIMCGRAAHEYDDFENEATHKMESRKVGVKMRAETETGYEPDLLLLMERVSEGSKSKGKKKSSLWVHQATVLKDRTDLMNGSTFENPTFETFRPIIKFLNMGGTHQGTDTTRDSTALFKDNDRSFEERKIQKQIAIEKLDEVLTLGGLTGTSVKAKEDRTKLLVQVFGQASKTYIEEKITTKELLAGIETIRKLCQKELVEEINTRPTSGVTEAQVSP